MTKAGPAAPAKETQRLDRWLWFARVAKSRTLAAAAVEDGKIKVNRVKADRASQPLKVGDVVTSRLHRQIRVLKVVGLGERRGPAAEAQGLYEDLTPPEPPVVGKAPDMASWGERAQGSGRPTKRDRRQIAALKDGT